MLGLWIFGIQLQKMVKEDLNWYDSDGNTVVSKLVLLDEKTGNKWQIKISDGELIAEPLELEDKREYKLNKILK